MSTQIYEEYWDLTLAWTDFNGTNFLKALETIINFIDRNQVGEYSQEYYRNLQIELGNSLGLNEASIRKGINEFVKLGFINCKLRSYPALSKSYLNAKTNEERKLIFSQIVYSNSSFKRSVTEDSDEREINFVVKSLEKMQELPIFLIPALMTIKISEYPQGYILKKELVKMAQDPRVLAFAERKYNQIAYLSNLLKKLDGIYYDSESKVFVLGQESEQVEISKTKECAGRDSYLQRLYKEKLQQESKQFFCTIRCMVEGLSYPYMIASHIKPFRECDEVDAFDSQNGLLLSKNVDALFDKYYISFDDEGKIIFYNRVASDIKEAWKDYKVVPIFMNDSRRRYLARHREICEACN